MPKGLDGDRAWARWWGVAAVAIVGGFFLVTFGALREATNPSWQDTEGYLGHSLYVAEHGGLAGFLREAFAGTFPVTERHPLYMLLLAPLAMRDARFFWHAKLVNLGLGALALATCLWMARRRYGRGPALLAGAFYGASQSLVVASSHVNHEPLFVLCSLWCWWWLTSGTSVRAWLFAGLFAGLAYLTKSSGTLLILATVAAELWQTRGRGLVTKRLWIFLLSAGVVASPLLVRNLRGYGALLYEGVNTHIMWMDRWSELGDPASIMSLDHYGVKTIERNRLPTLSSYVKTHRVRDALKRLGGGWLTEIRLAGRALSPATAIPRPVAVIWGLGVLAASVAGWWLTRQAWSSVLLVAWGLALMTFFGWNAQLFPEMRYLAPLVPILAMCAGWALWRLLARALRIGRAVRMSLVLCAGVVASASAWTVGAGKLNAPQPLMSVSPAYERLLEWINRDLAGGGSLLLGPTQEFYGLLWYTDAPVKVFQSPAVTTREAFLSYLAEREIDYVVIHPENVQGTDGKLAGALAPHWFVAPDGSIGERAPLDGFRLVYADEGMPRRFLVYRVSPSQMGQRAADG